MRFNQRKKNGQLGRMTLVELGIVEESDFANKPVECSRCGHIFSPILITGKCPICGYQGNKRGNQNG